MSAKDAPQSLAELERWADTVRTLEECDTQQGGKPDKSTVNARAALIAAATAGGRRS